MNLSKNRQEVFCHICNRWLIIRTETYLNNESILCLECDACLGYTWDLPELFGKNEEDNGMGYTKRF